MLRGILRGLKDLVYPNTCLICKKIIPPLQEQELICLGCWERLEKNTPPFCAACGRHLSEKDLAQDRCAHCANAAFSFDRAFSPCCYRGTVKKLIREFKYSGKDYLEQRLGNLLNGFIRDYQLPVEHCDLIIPVPLHAGRLREREFNQAESLGRQIGKEFFKPILTDGLIRIKPTKTQTQLNQEQRYRNLKGSFFVTHPELIAEKNVLLVDDVLTTGATASTAAQALKESGAHKVILLTLAS